ncbi:hypothetical protein M3Y94_01250400 [Aphelenchoides besseyi]|nr:hypothetical protein M3Y94_01250400 [Aphelenchoides besseyi]
MAADPPPAYTPTSLCKSVGDDSRYRCWCQTHVFKGTIAISVFGIVNSSGALLLNIFGFVYYTWFVWLTLWPPLVNIILYTCLLIGNRKKKTSSFLTLFANSLGYAVLDGSNSYHYICCYVHT